MRNFLIIGAGQLGSRHLQGLLKINGSYTIYIVDPSENSLKTARERATEIEHDHSLHFVLSMKDIPEFIDLAIVSTSANIRLHVCKLLFTQCKVKYLILEKVLFQHSEEYFEFHSLLEKTDTKCWVNHPRRMFDHFKNVQELIHFDGFKHYSAFGSDWGLACNSLHFIDLFCFLSNSTLKHLNTSNLVKQKYDSKRIGFIEFYGSLEGVLENGDTFSIHCPNEPFSDITISISTSNHRLLIQEGSGSFVSIHKKSDQFIPNVISFSPMFQSALTTLLGEELIANGKCPLPTYENAQKNHLIFISSLLDFYNSIQEEKTTILPIT